MSYKGVEYNKVKYNPEQLLNKFKEYIQYCEDKEIKMPNIAGFCIYAEIDKQTYYNYKTNADYNSTFELIDMMHENSTLNSKENPIMRIFYLKNKFDYIDKKEVVTHTDRALESPEDIEQKQLAIYEEVKKRKCIEAKAEVVDNLPNNEGK